MNNYKRYLLGLVAIWVLWVPLRIYGQDKVVLHRVDEFALVPHNFSFDEDELELDALEEELAYPSCPDELEAFLSSLEYKHFTYDDFVLTTYITVSKKGKLKVDSVGVLGNYFDAKLLDKAFVAELTQKLPLVCDWVPVSVSDKKVAKSQQILILLSSGFFMDEDDIEIVDTYMPAPPRPQPAPPSIDTQMEESASNERIFEVVEVMPKFPGGDEALVNYIEQNFKPTPDAIKYAIEGRILISFVVNSDGSITDVKPILPTSRQLGYGLEEAAAEMIKAMPPWTPGMQRNKKVAVRYTLPIKVTAEQ